MRQYKFLNFDLHDNVEDVISDIQDNYTYNEIVRLFRDTCNSVDVYVDGELQDEWLSLDIDEDTEKVFVKD